MAWVWSLVLSAVSLGVASAQFCGGQANLNIGQTTYFQSPQYPYPYPGGLACRWIVNSPPGTKLELNCDLNVAPSNDCTQDRFSVSPSGDLNKDYKYFCGFDKSFKFESNTNKFDAYFATVWPSFNYQYQGFQCSLKVVPSTTNPTEPPVVTESPNTGGDCKCGKKVAGNRIVGGQVAELHEWRWQAALRLREDNLQFCGATLIADQWLLTAAHCMVNFQTSSVTVSLGEHDKNTGSDTTATRHIGIKRSIIHPDYDTTTQENDIALLELESYTSNTAIHPICLPTKNAASTFAGSTGTVTGWGTTSWQGQDSSHLQEVELPIITNTKCSNDLEQYTITDKMICTYAVGKDACQGDSGGPLVWKSPSGHYNLVGVVSFGYRCAETGYPGVYTRVTKYLPWIKSNTGLSFCDPI
ncbi:unnamed protein product, partial [Meganyctiphanes norvegica]